MNISAVKYQALLRELGEEFVRRFAVKSGIDLSATVDTLFQMEQRVREIKRSYAFAFVFCSMFLSLLFLGGVFGPTDASLKICGFLSVLLVIFLVRAFSLDVGIVREYQEGSRKLFSRLEELMKMLNPLDATQVHYNERWLFNTLVVIAAELLKIEMKMTKSFDPSRGTLDDVFKLELVRFQLYAKYAHLSVAAKEFGLSFDEDAVFGNAAHVCGADLLIVVGAKESARNAVAELASIVPPLVQ